MISAVLCIKWSEPASSRKKSKKRKWNLKRQALGLTWERAALPFILYLPLFPFTLFIPLYIPLEHTLLCLPITTAERSILLCKANIVELMLPSILYWVLFIYSSTIYLSHSLSLSFSLSLLLPLTLTVTLNSNLHTQANLTWLAVITHQRRRPSNSRLWLCIHTLV